MGGWGEGVRGRGGVGEWGDGVGEWGEGVRDGGVGVTGGRKRAELSLDGDLMVCWTKLNFYDQSI